jgi:hypothetical protein
MQTFGCCRVGQAIHQTFRGFFETNSEMKIAFELKNIGPLKSNLEFVDHNYNWMHFG